MPPLPTPQLPVFRGPPQLHEDYEVSLQPVFHPVNTDIRVVEGGTAFLQCRVSFLGPHHLVSWLRVRDMTVMSVGGLVFSSDSRVSVTFLPTSNQEHMSQLEVGISFDLTHNTDSPFPSIQIENVGVGDSGQYQCQVNTDSTLSVTLVLTILGQ